MTGLQGGRHADGGLGVIVTVVGQAGMDTVIRVDRDSRQVHATVGIGRGVGVQQGRHALQQDEQEDDEALEVARHGLNITPDWPIFVQAGRRDPPAGGPRPANRARCERHPQLAEPYLTIMLASLAAGLAAGFVMHRSDFCVTAMFRDLFLFRDAYLLRMLVLLVVTSMLLFELARAAGWLSPYPFPLLGPPSAASLIGGFVFGIGMVLAGGCVVGTLYKLGAGSLASGVALLGMLAGSALYAEVHPAWGAFAKATLLDARAVTLPQWLGLAPAVLILPVAGLGALLLLRWARAGALTRVSHAAGHLPAWRATLILAGLGLFSYLLVGMPLGITTSYAKLGANVEAWFWPEHVAGLAYFAALPLDYTPPFADRAIQGGPGPAFDAVGAIQYPLIVGIILGAFISTLLVREFRVRLGVPPRQLASALIGGVLLGVSARMIPGCNVWHLWGGLPILALQSLLFLAGLIPGSWVGSRLLVRFVIR